MTADALSEEADYLRALVSRFTGKLMAPHPLTEAQRQALCKLTFEIDRLADRAEELGGAIKSE